MSIIIEKAANILGKFKPTIERYLKSGTLAAVIQRDGN